MTRELFEIIPAIDILDGKCVRLTQGQYNKVEEFSSDPIEIAKKWTEMGARRIHLVDLDGAREGHPVNNRLIIKIREATSAKIEVGGGIRTHASIKEYLTSGVAYIILGTKVFQDKTFLSEVQEQYKDQIIVGLDMKNNKVALSGWHETTDFTLIELSGYLNNIKQIIYTDVSKDGTLSGPNMKSVEEIAGVLKSNIIVSGGISSLDDVLAVIKLKKTRTNITGVILGKSLYKGTINLSLAIETANKELKH